MMDPGANVSTTATRKTVARNPARSHHAKSLGSFGRRLCIVFSFFNTSTLFIKSQPFNLFLSL